MSYGGHYGGGNSGGYGGYSSGGGYGGSGGYGGGRGRLPRRHAVRLAVDHAAARTQTRRPQAVPP